MHPDIRRVFELQQKRAKELARTSVDERIERLMRIDNYLKDEDRLADLFDAMYKDFRKPEVEVIGTEVGVVQAHISYVRRKLKGWVRQKKVPTPLPLLGTRSHIQYEPKGVVLIIAPWNYPLNLTLVPLVYAIAAGNAVVLKPSEISSHTSTYIKEMISELFDESEVSVFEGDAGVAQELLNHPFNHIFFTGSPRVGKTVMQKAAQNLTSVTLELGGKSPAIIDETADIRKSARGVAWSKSVNNGQTCITPDYLLLHESIQEEFIEEFEMALKELYDPHEKGIENSPDYCRIINDRHFKRLRSLYDDACNKGARVLVGGNFNESERFIDPTLIGQVTEEMDIMQEEIFGPLLPSIVYKDRNVVLDIINRRPKPLTIYISSKRHNNIDYFIEGTSAGGTVINDYMLGYSNPNLPFGGINNSGIGKSMGFHGFIQFSNERSVVRRKWGSMDMIYPPYTDRIRWLIKALYRWF